LATQGLLPICALYSTFAQRAYDQIIHDVALQELPVIFAIDRSGLVGADGPTHHGVFDIAYLRAIPSIEIFAPLDAQELVDLLHTLVLKFENNKLLQPVAIRYPRGSSGLVVHPTPKEINPYALRRLGDLESSLKKVALISTGAIAEELSQVTQLPNGVDHFHCVAIKPLDISGLESIFEKYQAVVILEDAAVNASLGSAIVSLAQELGHSLSIECLGVPDRFITHGSVSALRTEIGLDAATIIKRLQQTLDRMM
jgi:1-deoxy-D-xylulose-5-phosphate synthase